MRQRRHRSAQARPGGALAAMATGTGGARLRAASATAALEGICAGPEISPESVAPLGPNPWARPETRGGIAGASMWCLCSCLSEKLHRGTRPACNTSRVQYCAPRISGLDVFLWVGVSTLLITRPGRRPTEARPGLFMNTSVFI